jgi:DNA polymerase III epsilon subunit-like protein
MLVLGIDFETQDDQAETTNITEVGAVLVSFEPYALGEYYERKQVIGQLCYESNYPPQKPEIVELTGITDDMLRADGHSKKEVFSMLLPLVEQADLVCAHNKKFDQAVFNAECRRQGIPIPDKRWLCTLTEMPYPAKYTCKKLSHLAWEHDIEVDRKSLHRAEYDVQLMLQLVLKYGLANVLAYADEPWVYFQAVIPAPWVDQGIGKQKAQKMGYSWQSARHDERVFDKCWVKRVKASQVDSERSQAEKIGLSVRSIS